MQPTLERVLRDWLASPLVHAEDVGDVLVWAGAFGTDVERAWNECPRADYLALIAGAYGGDAARMTALVCDLADEALPVIRGRAAAASMRLVRRGDEAGMASRLPTMAAAIEREVRAHTACVERTGPSLARVMTALRRRAPVLGPMDSSARFDEVSTLPAVHSSLRQWRRQFEIGASACGLRLVYCALTCSMAVGLVDTVDALFTEASADTAARREAHAQVFAESAVAFRQTAAIADHQRCGASGTFARMLGELSAIALSESRGAANFTATFATATAAGRAAGAETLARLASRVREAVPFASLAGAPRTAAEKARLASDPRSAFRESVDRLASSIAGLDEPAVTEAYELTCAVLAAPGPFERARFFRALSTFYERFGIALEARVGDRSPEDRAITLARARDAREMAREIERLARGGASLD
jgi:hypothetical protein